jgi:hypothetical protein
VTSAVFGFTPRRYDTVGGTRLGHGAHAHRVDKEVTHSEPDGGMRTLWEKRMGSNDVYESGVWV